MLRRIDLTDVDGGYERLLPRADAATVAEVRRTAGSILDRVGAEGDEAVADLAADLDGWPRHAQPQPGPARWDVPRDERREALDRLDGDLRAALERAVDQVRAFHERARPADWDLERDGARMGVRHQPIRRVGVYTPGGLGAYPSTVVMTVVPARVAGVDEVVLCTPPDEQGEVSPVVLAAAELTGADRVLRVGGAQAVAAMAHGTDAVPRCAKVVGPGNAYVAEAKQQAAARGLCGIDVLAGVTEVAVIADDTADPVHVAADLVAQAEHDPQAACLLITPSASLIDRVEQELAREVAATRHVERVTAALDGQGAAALVADVDQAVDVVDAWGPEHLEVQTAEADRIASRVRAAGAVFVGPTTPVSLGDYCAGPNHTLPTGGTARFTGGLRTDDFLVPVSWVRYDREALADLEPVVAALSAAEDLPAHHRAVRARLERGR